MNLVFYVSVLVFIFSFILFFFRRKKKKISIVGISKSGKTSLFLSLLKIDKKVCPSKNNNVGLFENQYILFDSKKEELFSKDILFVFVIDSSSIDQEKNFLKKRIKDLLLKKPSLCIVLNRTNCTSVCKASFYKDKIKKFIDSSIDKKKIFCFDCDNIKQKIVMCL